MGERSRISGPAICASSAHGTWVSTSSNSRCSACCVRGEFVSHARRRSFAAISWARFPPTKGDGLARKTVLVSDMSGVEIPEGKGATIRITFRDARKGVRELDVTDEEAEKLGGRSVARRGRRPKSAG